MYGQDGYDPNKVFYNADGSSVGWAKEGDELFRQVQDSEGNPLWDTDISGFSKPRLESAGVYHKDTQEEAIAKLLARGGDSAVGGRKDFMGATTLDDLAKDHSGKWGQDYVTDPEFAKYANDPAWVTKDDTGNITAMRAELVPFMLREALGEEFRDINRGGTKAANGFGDLVKMVVIGTVTAGFGTAAAMGMGMSTGAGATAALTTGGKIVAGAVSGGMSAGLQGGRGRSQPAHGQWPRHGWHWHPEK
jgi:hypothetical protein